MGNYIHDKVRNEITHPCLNFNGCTVEWISYLSHTLQGMWLFVHARIKLIHVSRRNPRVLFRHKGAVSPVEESLYKDLIIFMMGSVHFKRRSLCWNVTQVTNITWSPSLFIDWLQKENFGSDKSTSVQEMTWCCYGTSHCRRQWQGYRYEATEPKRVNSLRIHLSSYSCSIVM